MPTASEKPVLQGQRRLYDKKHYCLYCQKGYCKISRHLERVHRSEPEVANAVRFPKNSKERHVRLSQLRNQGNFVHNSTVARTGDGELVVRRRFGLKRELRDFRYCRYCKGLFTKLLLWRHVKNCKLKPKDCGASTSGRLQMRSISALSGSFPLDISEDLKKLFCRMAEDQISNTIKEERCILQLGESMLARLGGDGMRYEYIRQTLRSVARLLMEVRRRTPLRNLEELLLPSNITHVVTAVRGAAGFDEQRHLYRTPSLARRLSYGLHGICRLMEQEALAKGNSHLAQSTCDFREMLHQRWGELVPKGTPVPLGVDEFGPPLQLRFAEDVKLLNSYLDRKLEELQSQLQLDPTKQSYSDLTRVILAQVVLFNRSRQGVVSTMPLAAFMSRDKTPGEPLNEDNSISKLDRTLCQHFARVELSGRCGERVLVLLKPTVAAAMELLVLNRKECGVPPENPHMFARPGALSCYESGVCIRQFADECEAENADAISSVKLRRFVATILNVISLKEGGALVDLFSRDFEANGKHGLLTAAATATTIDDDLQLAELAKALLAMEKGTSSEFAVGADNSIYPKEPSCAANPEDPADKPPVLENPDHTGPGPNQKILCPKQGAAKRKWESGEVEAVERHLMKYIRACRLPGKGDCLKCVQSEPQALKDRSWSSVKFYVKNRITASKKLK